MSDKKYLEGIDQVVENALAHMNVPGAAVGIVENGEVVFTGSYGYANLEKKIKLSPQHLMPLGSSSKAFTATAVVMLAADGLLSLDTPIREYLPSIRFFDETATQQATFRDLLCHRTGLPRHDDMWYGWESLDRKDMVLNRIRHFHPNKPFRSKWEYSNHMFALAGYLIEVISGKTWEDFVAERIFGSLGITHYSFKYPRDFSKDAYVTLYTPDDDGIHQYTEPLRFDAMGPAGSILLTVEDFAKWAAFNAAGGKIGEEQLIDPVYFAELLKPNMPYELLPFTFEERFPVGYALGWFVDSFRGQKLVEHGGNVAGGCAIASFLPGKNTGCVVLANCDSSMLPLALSATIHDRILGHGGEKNWIAEYDENYKAVAAEIKKVSAAILDKKIPGKPVSHDLEEYEGTYSNGGYGELTVTAKDGKLEMSHHDMTFMLDHLHYETFTFEFLKAMYKTLTFRTNVEGNVDAALMTVFTPFETPFPDDPILFEKVKSAEEE
jgi:CubicO group peptidase (beta-lactamase class C family)